MQKISKRVCRQVEAWYKGARNVERIQARREDLHIESHSGYDSWKLNLGPNRLSEGWKEMFLDGPAFISCLPHLSLRKGLATRCFVFSWTAGARAKVFMVPDDARVEPVEGEPALETVPKAIPNGLRMVEGDGSYQSYFEAAMLERSFAEVGAFWHGLPHDYGHFTWERPRTGKWKSHRPVPRSVLPVVSETEEGIKVVYYAHKTHYGEALLEIVVKFERGCYLPDTTIYTAATGSGGFVVY